MRKKIVGRKSKYLQDSITNKFLKMTNNGGIGSLDWGEYKLMNLWKWISMRNKYGTSYDSVQTSLQLIVKIFLSTLS